MGTTTTEAAPPRPRASDDLANQNATDAFGHDPAPETRPTGRDGPASVTSARRGSSNRGRIPPSAKWLDAFEAQTPATMKDAARFAERRALALVLAGGVAVGDELVLDALGDTFTGDVTWDPDRVSLTQHVRGVIAVRVRHEIARQAKIPHLPMTGDLDSGDGLDMVAVAASRVVAADEDAPPQRIAMRASAASAMAALRRMAFGDADVIAILDAFEAECYSREEIRDVTGLTVRAYDNARRRLAALAEKLPPAIRIGLRLHYP